MTKGTDNLDEFAINEYLEEGEHFEFVKPWFAQGWAVGLFWVLSVGLVDLYLYSTGESNNIIHSILVLVVVFSAYKFFTSTRRIEVKGDYVRVHSFNIFNPVKEYRFSRMTSWLEVDSIFIIKKKSYSGGTTFKKIYWYPHWNEMKRIFIAKPAYCMQRDARSDRNTVNKGAKTAGGFGSGGCLLTSFVILFEWLSTPYLLLCRAIFGR